MVAGDTPELIPALRVRQWLPEWEDIKFDGELHRRRPPEAFLLTTLRASDLRALSGIQRRSVTDGRARLDDTKPQRRHNEERSKEIAEFVKHGFPWSALSNSQRKSGDFDDLKKPGWLPTAIVANILISADVRDNGVVDPDDLVDVIGSDTLCSIKVPKNLSPSWKPKQVHPIEIIDGQHRLWAFDDGQDLDYELPVVLFHGLDSSWQAYLFFVINLKPAKINTSLGFDLYPLLRTEDWLDRADGPIIYRETRAQELTEALWAHPRSPWQSRIEMLGESRKFVSQAAWIRSLLQTFIKKWESSRSPIGGLFGAPAGGSKTVLPWTRSQQAAFLIFFWNCLRDAIRDTSSEWAVSLRAGVLDLESDPAFEGPTTLPNTDQGVRAILAVFNDLCFIRADELKLRDWASDDFTERTNHELISESLETLGDQEALADFLKMIATELAAYDWRTYSAENLTDDQKSEKARYRGSTGYRVLRNDVLAHLARSSITEVSVVAREVLSVHDGK